MGLHTASEVDKKKLRMHDDHRKNSFYAFSLVVFEVLSQDATWVYTLWAEKGSLKGFLILKTYGWCSPSSSLWSLDYKPNTILKHKSFSRLSTEFKAWISSSSRTIVHSPEVNKRFAWPDTVELFRQEQLVISGPFIGSSAKKGSLDV